MVASGFGLSPDSGNAIRVLLTVLIGTGSKPTTDRKMDKNPKEGREKNRWEAFI